jgi:hypothetical protein
MDAGRGGGSGDEREQTIRRLAEALVGGET